ncbi:hypothetical protein TGARI_263642B, partial [Toxoplasma gondii ARI]
RRTPAFPSRRNRRASARKETQGTVFSLSEKSEEADGRDEEDEGV